MIADSEYILATPASSYRLRIITSPPASYNKGETKLKMEEKLARSVEGGPGLAKAAEIMPLPLHLLNMLRMMAILKSFGQMLKTMNTLRSLVL